VREAWPVHFEKKQQNLKKKKQEAGLKTIATLKN
jgi:hypothetical protein